MKLLVNKMDAIELLESNKEKHVAEYELQLEAWKKAYAEHTEALNKWAQSSDHKEVPQPKEPFKPKYYVAEYDKLIQKLTVHQQALIELDADGYSKEYEKIFENSFEWSNSFATLSSNYISSGHISSSKISAIRIGESE